MSVAPGRRLEFMALIFGLAEAYGADRKDFEAAVRLVVAEKRGRPKKDDGAMVREMVLAPASGRSRWAIAKDRARQITDDVSQSEDSKARRLYAKAKRERAILARFGRPTTGNAQPFDLAAGALDMAREWERDKRIQRKVRISRKAQAI